MENENLKLWRSVEKTNPNYTKRANVKGNNITSIAPQFQILNATEKFGVYGITWGFKNISIDYTLTELTGLIYWSATFFFPNGEFPATNSISVWRDGAKTKPDDQFAKKVETDSLTKCLSKLGFNADIFLGKFDDVRYLNELNEEFGVNSQPNDTNDDKKWLNKFENDKKTISRDWTRALATIKTNGVIVGINKLQSLFKISKDNLKELKNG